MKNTIGISYLYPEHLENPFRRIDFAAEVKREIGKTLSEKFPDMKYIMGDDEDISKNFSDKMEKTLDLSIAKVSNSNIDVLTRLFPASKSSTDSISKICPALLLGTSVCAKLRNSDAVDVLDVYDIKDKKCIDCACSFWSARYDNVDNSNATDINVEERKRKLINPFIVELSKCFSEKELNAMHMAFVCAFGEDDGASLYYKNKIKIKNALKTMPTLSEKESLCVAMKMICKMENIVVPHDIISNFSFLYPAYYVSSSEEGNKKRAYKKAINTLFNKEESVKLLNYSKLFVLL